MSEDPIAAEICRLIEEQREFLKGKLSPEQAEEYLRRNMLIEELLAKLTREFR